MSSEWSLLARWYMSRTRVRRSHGFFEALQSNRRWTLLWMQLPTGNRITPHVECEPLLSACRKILKRWEQGGKPRDFTVLAKLQFRRCVRNTEMVCDLWRVFNRNCSNPAWFRLHAWCVHTTRWTWVWQPEDCWWLTWEGCHCAITAFFSLY